MDSSLTKTTLRRQLLWQRRALAVEQWHTLSQGLCQQLRKSQQWQNAATILAYISFRQEPDLSDLFQVQLDRSQPIWGLPRCVGSDLVWHRWSPTQPETLRSGAYGILEPHADLPTIPATAVDLILVPAVACDRQGFRLGYGGGYYDRLLANPSWSGIPTIGLVFSFALVPQLPRDPWDLPLQAVCTETGFYPCLPV